MSESQWKYLSSRHVYTLFNMNVISILRYIQFNVDIMIVRLDMQSYFYEDVYF